MARHGRGARKRARGGAKRPFRWLGATVPLTDAPGMGYLNSVIQQELQGAGGVLPTTYLAQGQFDVEPWADNQEVTIDRIVGNLAFNGHIVNPTGNLIPPTFLVRAGIIVIEESSADPTSVDPSRELFDATDLEEAEWMWLYQVAPYVGPPIVSTGNAVNWQVRHNVDVDIRVRRKLGPRDILALYTSYAWDASSPILPDAPVWNVACNELIRVGVMSR